MKEENGQNGRTVHLVVYRPSPIPTSGLKIPLILVFKSPRYVTPMKIKEFLTSLYSYEFIAKKTEQLSSEEEINLLIQDSSEGERKVAKHKKCLL